MKKIIIVSVLIFKIAFLENAHAAPQGDAASRVAEKCWDYVQRKHGLLFMGYSGATFDAVNEMSFFFASDRKLDIELAREQMVKVTEGCLKIINSDVEIRPFLKRYPFTAENISIKIDYMKNTGKEDDFYCTSMYLGDVIFMTYLGKVLVEERYQTSKEKIGCSK